MISVRILPDEIRRGDVAEMGRRRGNWAEVMVEEDRGREMGKGGVVLVMGKGEGVGGWGSMEDELFGVEGVVEWRWSQLLDLALGLRG